MTTTLLRTLVADHMWRPPHVLPMEKPDVVTRLVLDFLAGGQ